MGSRVRRPQVVIVGAGFGGLRAARDLWGAPVDITVIDRRNHHLFQPFLYQVATSALAGTDIAVPIRHILRKQKNVRVLMGEVTGVDTQARCVRLADGHLIAFDYLVLATGSRHSYFGNPDWERFAPGLKSIMDATTIRSQILTAFEMAELEQDLVRRRKLMTFVLVGGGPTGVEMAGAIATLSKRVLRSDYRCINPLATRIILIEAAPRLLTAFPESLSESAQAELELSGVEIRLNAKVEKIDAQGVHIPGLAISAQTILWTAGVEASPAGKWLGAECDRAGRVRVHADLSVPGHSNIFVIGDTALVSQENGGLVPGLAPAAIQQGQYVARLIRIHVTYGSDVDFLPFHYQNKGSLATLGKVRAVADFGRFSFDGFMAWVLWALVHVTYLVTFRNRLVVMLKWAFLFSTFHARDSLIITRESGQQEAEGAAALRKAA